MKQSSILLKMLFGLMLMIGVSKANAQTISSLADFNPAAIAVYCSGDQVKLTASSTGAASYVWKRYTGSSVSGAATTVTGNAPNMTDVPAAPGYYTYVSTSLNSDGCESAVSDPAVVYVLPGITASIVSNTPATTQYCTNAVPTGLTLTATGGESTTVPENFAYSYQWYKNGTQIAGATGQTYTLNSTNDATVGSTMAYTVQINYVSTLKTCSAATSNAINFNVIALPGKPTITITP